MPQVISAPVSQVITNGGTDLFGYPATSAASVLSLQAPASQPLPAGTATAANLLNPDLQVGAQLVNFPSSVYDTTPTSILFHLMSALLGDAGAGQLRKRQMVARLQQAVTSTSFYDLDSFYGALFNCARGPSASLPQNPASGQAVSPYTDLADPDGWDEVQGADAQFRERVIALAKAITLGATVPGIRALGEAVAGVTCQIYEIWRLEAGGGGDAGNTWADVTGEYTAWSAIPAGETWQQLEGVAVFTGLLGIGSPNEVVLQPQKTYDSTLAGQQQQAADLFGIESVVEALRPASVLIDVNTTGLQTVVPVPISAAWADSEYWELVHLVTPSDASSPAYAPMVSSYQPNAPVLPAGTYIQPSPPCCRSQGAQYSCCGDVTSVTAQAARDGDVISGRNFQTVAFPSRQVPYTGPQAVMPAGRAATARAASSVAVRCAPYSGPRVPVMRAT